ncbi:MAG: VWA domain-containing protein, partial [Desulfobacterales bacterium]|nr:VWA domain-containing protein [Desulfobacterales bacterium]
MKRIISLLSVVLWLAGAAGAVLADDIDIYGTTTVSVQPNVLIIFDNSGSMSTEDVGGEFYDPDTTYTGSKLTNAVYRRTGSGWWLDPYVYTTVYINNVDNLLCASVKDDLKTKGYADGVRLKSDTRCGTFFDTRYYLRLGNFINYEASDPDDPVSRISVAKQVITNLINDTDNVRLGLMAFNYEQGGYVRKAIGSTKSELVTSVNALTASTWTPLAETLAEAGLYFAGKSSWYNSGTYTSPIQYRCQKNYIILMTDGEPTHDVDWRLATGAYINGDTIGDQDGDGHEPGGANAISYDSSGSDYLDDVATYLHDNDLRQGAGTNPTEDFDATDFPTQNITGIFTIGFKTAQALLQETAANGNGEYYTAESASGLEEAFDSIMSSIVEANAVFVAPVVPVSRTSRTYSGDKIYIGFFHPESDGRWLGNIKKYSLNSDGNIVDVNDNVATDNNGAIVDSAQSYWSASADGADVLAGGLGALLKAQASRNLYTYLETNTALTHADNAFTAGNTALTAALLGVSSDERAAVIADVTNGSET